MPPWERALFGDVWPTEKRRIMGFGKRVSCEKKHPYIVSCIFAQGVAFLGVAVMAPALKFLLALIF